MNRYHAAAIALIAAFVILAGIVSIKESPLLSGDSSAFLAVNNSHSHTLNAFMVALTKYGREVFWIAAIILLFVFGGWSGKKAAVIMAISMAVLIVVGTVAKDAIGRERPVVPAQDVIITSDTDGSFPSGHATIVSAGAAVAWALFRDTSRKLAVTIGLTIEAALVCISRVYVGGHYPSDVIGGILLGVGVAFVFVGLAPRIEKVLMPVAKTLKIKK
ncbi:MAG: phosphatase PAP2 family protein [Nitrososphaera sp.]